MSDTRQNGERHKKTDTSGYRTIIFITQYLWRRFRYDFFEFACREGLSQGGREVWELNIQNHSEMDKHNSSRKDVLTSVRVQEADRNFAHKNKPNGKGGQRIPSLSMWRTHQRLHCAQN